MNGQGTKSQHYKYSMRTAISQSFWCTGVILMRLQEPDDALTLENLFMHFRHTFDTGVASGDRKITRIGVVDTQPGLGWFDPIAGAYPVLGSPTWHRYVDVNYVADGSRVVDFNFDLTSLIDKSRPGNNLVYVKAVDILNSNQGNISIWKQDGIYTTTGIA